LDAFNVVFSPSISGESRAFRGFQGRRGVNDGVDGRPALAHQLRHLALLATHHGPPPPGLHDAVIGASQAESRPKSRAWAAASMIGASSKIAPSPPYRLAAAAAPPWNSSHRSFTR
jgi:hypothetical protein